MKNATKALLILSAITLIFVAVLAACGNRENDEEVSFRAMRDVELGVVITLGDTLAQVESALGRSIRTVSERKVFENGMEITFTGGRVTAVEAVNPLDSGRFEIYGFRAGMPMREIAEIFYTHHDMSEGFSEMTDGSVYFFMRYFDGKGNDLGDIQVGRPDGTEIGNFIDWWNTPLENSLRLTVIDFINSPALG